MVLDPGTLLDGRYRVDVLVGRGGMAEVHRALDERLRRPVAVKVLRGVEPGDAQRFEAEARALARLAHPGIVAIYDVGDHDGVPDLVVDLVEGGSLADELRAGALAPARAAAVGHTVAGALGHAHGLGVVHRDVKPANILVGHDGRARLADFGIARMAGSPKLTGTGTVMGTASYLAPEQLRGEAVGPPADVYALGLVLVECLSGGRAYGGTAAEAALARLHRSPRMPTDVERWWVELAAAMTEIDPIRRPSAEDVADVLARQPGSSAPPAAPAPAVPPLGPAGPGDGAGGAASAAVGRAGTVPVTAAIPAAAPFAVTGLAAGAPAVATDRLAAGGAEGSPPPVPPAPPRSPERRWLVAGLVALVALGLLAAVVLAAGSDDDGPGTGPRDGPSASSTTLVPTTTPTTVPTTAPPTTAPPGTTSPPAVAPGPDDGPAGRPPPGRGRDRPKND